MINKNSIHFEMGNWLVEPDRNRLSRAGETFTIENKAMDVLVLLASHPGQVFSNDDLIEKIWEGRPMGENPVYKCVASLRKVLGDDRKAPKYIETIARKGYRLVCDIEQVSHQKPAPGINARYRDKHLFSGRSAALLVAFLLGLAVFVPGFFYSQVEQNKDESQSKVSIAVLPFENLSADPANEFFCHGIADDILSRLARLPNLRVIARTSSFLKGSQVDNLPEFASSLGAHYFLMGSVRQLENQVRITARLLTEDGTIVWTESFERDLDGITRVQNDIARAVVKGLAINVGDWFAEEPSQTNNYVAYSAYLLGNEYLYRRVRDWRIRAVAAYKKAIRTDPAYAAPYAGLAITYMLSNWQSQSHKLDAEAALATALRLDPDLPQGYVALGLQKIHQDSIRQDHVEAVRMFRHALELDPSLQKARNLLSISLKVLGEYELSLGVLEEAVELDPLNIILNGNLGIKYHEHGRFDEARDQYYKTLSLPDAGVYLWEAIARIDVSEGNLDVALERLKEGVRKDGLENDTYHYVHGVIASFYARLGMFEVANKWIDFLALPDRGHQQLALRYTVWAPQKKHQQLGEWFRRYAATLSEERPLTLLSRSLSGSFAVLQGEYAGAIKLLEPLFESGWILQNVPGGGENLFNTLHFLAVAYQKTGQPELAMRVLNEALEKQQQIRDQHSFLISGTLIQEAVTYRLLGQNELAITRLQEAVDAGWRLYYLTVHNPCWDAFRGDPEFERIMAEVKAEVDAQRKRVLATELLQPFEPEQFISQQVPVAVDGI